MEDKLKNFRQPLVTSSGLILGFILNVAAGWAMAPEKKHNYVSLVNAVCMMICILLLVIVLYRTLNISYPRADAEAYYKKTLLCFITGILIIFMNFLFIIIQNFFTGS